MPILGPSDSELLDSVLPTGSPYWLCLNGVWLQVEGVTPGVEVSTERASSELVTIDGNRYAQRAAKGMRQWTLAFTYADTVTVAALRAAVDSDADVWLFSEAVGLRNMLPARSCFGDSEFYVVDCGGVPLRSFEDGDTATGRVRGGAPTTLSAWVTGTGTGDVAMTLAYPGGTASIMSLAGDVHGQASATFTPTSDGEVTVTTHWHDISGLTLTEGSAPTTWVPGESMPCKVAVADPDDSLTMHHGGAWRHDYSVVLREVG